MMHVTLGPTIRLDTHHGIFDVQHVSVQDARGDRSPMVREGVVLRSRCEKAPCVVRVQSSCLFSESFWATDCDCALQLQASLERVARDGGIILYFYEEGRGAGLAMKFKAVELQQARSMDTKAAYECLKLSVDSRTYEAAAAVLRRLTDGSPIVLLTNNPEKHRGLQDNGVNVQKCENLVEGIDKPAILRYLQEKVRILGHNIPGVALL